MSDTAQTITLAIDKDVLEGIHAAREVLDNGRVLLDKAAAFSAQARATIETFEASVAARMIENVLPGGGKLAVTVGLVVKAADGSVQAIDAFAKALAGIFDAIDQATPTTPPAAAPATPAT